MLKCLLDGKTETSQEKEGVEDRGWNSEYEWNIDLDPKWGHYDKE